MTKKTYTLTCTHKAQKQCLIWPKPVFVSCEIWASQRAGKKEQNYNCINQILSSNTYKQTAMEKKESVTTTVLNQKGEEIFNKGNGH